MVIEISFRDNTRTDALDAHVRGEIEDALGRFADRITRVEVHIGDRNGPRGGSDDKRCMMEARPAGSQPVAVEATGAEFHAVVTDAAGKLQRALGRRFDRADEVRSSGS